MFSGLPAPKGRCALGPGLAEFAAPPCVRTLIVCRHAERQDQVDPEWAMNAHRVYDPDLSDLGIEMARCLARWLSSFEHQPQEVYSSPFIRTARTGAICGAAIGCPVRLEPGLCEWAPGLMSFVRGSKGLPLLMATEMDTFLRPPNLPSCVSIVDASYKPFILPKYPETWKDVSSHRIPSAVKAILESSCSECVLLVGHGATIIGVLGYLLGWTIPETWVDARDLSGWDLCSVNVLSWQDSENCKARGRWALEAANLTSFLDETID